MIYENDLNPEGIVPMYSDLKNNCEQLKLNKYENIHSTNWNTVRVKVPTSESCGWRVEFRPMELQSDDFSNAAFLIFISLLSRAIIQYRPNWYVPISSVDINMNRAQKRHSVITELFYFCDENRSKVKEQTIQTIFNTQLITIIYMYLDEINISDAEKNQMEKYLNLIKLRANGEIPTDATKIRHFVINRPLYNKDSYISNEIRYD